MRQNTPQFHGRLTAQFRQRAEERYHLFEPEAICETIKVLERGGTADLTKGPFRYEKGSLAGLWKKHFSQASYFIPENILLEIEREGPGIIFRKFSEHYGPGKFMGKTMDETDVALVADLSRDAIERRAARGGLRAATSTYMRHSMVRTRSGSRIS